MMAAVTTAVAAVAMAMTMGCDGNGSDVDNGSDSSGGNAGDDDDGNNDSNGIYHVYLHLKKWMSILNPYWTNTRQASKHTLIFSNLSSVPWKKHVRDLFWGNGTENTARRVLSRQR